MSTVSRPAAWAVLNLLAPVWLAACAEPTASLPPGGPSTPATAVPTGSAGQAAGATPSGWNAFGGSTGAGGHPGASGAVGVGGGTAAAGSAGSEGGEQSDNGLNENAAATPHAPDSSGSISFHLLLGVSGYDAAQDAIVLDGDRYTDLILANYVAGVLYGHLLASYSPGIRFHADYLYGSIFGQLLQENLATGLYDPSKTEIDPSPDQQAVMGPGQGGPYQINNYAADMVYGGYAPDGYSLVNYVALQKNIGYSFESAAAQHERATPSAFNDKFFGPLLTAYFHFNDYVALQQVGVVGGYQPQWQPAFDQALSTFASLDGNFLDVLLNVAYNQGFYGPLLSSYSQRAVGATSVTVAQVNDYGSVWGKDDSYEQYPYQVRYYLDQLYDNPVPTTAPTTFSTPANHVHVELAALGQIFARGFTQLAYVDAAGRYITISDTLAKGAFGAALSGANLSSRGSLDLSEGRDRAQLFDVLERAITGLELATGQPFTARTTHAL